MNNVSTPNLESHSRTALATNSRPVIRSDVVRDAVPQHQPGQHPQNVPNSASVRNFRGLPSRVRSNTKSYAHTWLPYGGLSLRQDPSLSHSRPRLGCLAGTFSPPSPDPLHSLVIHSPAISRQQGRDPPVAISPVFAGQRDDVGGQNRRIVCHPGRVSLGASHLSQHTARRRSGTVWQTCPTA